VRKREREKEIEKVRHRETQRDRETERQRDKETERQRDRETERQRDRETERGERLADSFWAGKFPISISSKCRCNLVQTGFASHYSFPELEC
jgi:hypothetical protein